MNPFRSSGDLSVSLIALMMAASVCIAGAAVAQDATDPQAGDAQADPDNPVLNRNARRDFGLDRGRNGLPALRGSRAGAAVTTDPLATPPASSGEATGGEPTVGLSGGGEGLSRLPRFRTGGQVVSGSPTGGAATKTPPSLNQQRQAPPRRFGVPTRTIVKDRTQLFTTDLRLSPVIRNPVSGVPAPAALSTVPLPRAIPSLGLLNPSVGLLDPVFTRLPDEASDPAYAPLGIKLGTFTFLPAFTQYVGYDTNPAQTVARAQRGSVALRSEGELAFRSDWSSSELTGQLRGGYSEYPENEPASRPNAAGTSRLRVDVNKDTRVEIETRLLVDTQRLGSPDLGGGTSSTGRPLFATYGVTAGVVENFNRFQLSLRGAVDRQVFEDGRLADGTTLVQSDRNANQYSVRLRAGYEITPTITPFVETIVDTRVYDSPVDQTGLRRDSDGIGFIAGARVALSRTVAGEVSAGYQHRDYIDRTLRNIDAPLVSAALVWSVSPLTTVRFNQSTGVIETAVPGSSGVFTDIAVVEVQHDLLRNLSITVGGSYLSSQYEGVSIRETGFSALARLDYRFNRWLTFRGSYVYQRLDSTAQNASYDANIFLLGMRINP